MYWAETAGMTPYKISHYNMKMNSEYVLQVLFSLNPSFHISTVPLCSASGGWAKRTNLCRCSINISLSIKQLLCDFIHHFFPIAGHHPHVSAQHVVHLIIAGIHQKWSALQRGKFAGGRSRDNVFQRLPFLNHNNSGIHGIRVGRNRGGDIKSIDAN